MTQVASNPLVLVVAPTLGVKSVKELIALAQQRPGQLNFGSSGIGSGTHCGGELFKLAANLNVVHVQYRGTPEEFDKLIRDEIRTRSKVFKAAGAKAD